MRILAIETSHDDTSVALYEDRKVIMEKSISQTAFHQKYGGTVPEFASRLHAQNLPSILNNLRKSYDLTNVDHIAYTALPGLVGSLQMGRLAAEALGIALNKKVVPINHMHAHIYAVCFNHDITYPSLALIVSGGHTQLWQVNSPSAIVLLGETSDDAAGEAFDKVARMMGLDYPGGPAIEKAANNFSGSLISSFSLPHERSFNFSFSGLKTRVADYINGKHATKQAVDTNQVAYSFQQAVVDYLLFKTKYAISVLKPQSIILGGGVAANTLLRTEFAKLHEHSLIPEKRFTTDNAAMIAIMSHYLMGVK